MIDETVTIDKVLHIDTKEPVNINVNGKEEQLDIYSAARWLALIEGLEVINAKAAQLKIDLDKDKSWVKPLALQKYIEEQTPSCIAQVKTLKTENK
tara:strand:- start:215 stop:502 length:288 start_codon:yes stop_codon:yes gene_type:complete